MRVNSWKSRVFASVVVCMAFCTSSNAQTALLNEVHTIAASDQAAPVEHSFDVSVAGKYQVTLADLGVVPDGAATPTPAPLASVKLAVTSGATLVGTTLTAAGSMEFDAAIGTYVIHVIGKPGTAPGSGPIGIQVTDVTTNSALVSFSDTLALPSGALPNNESTLDDSFTVASDGSYVVTLADLSLPEPLTALTLVITTPSGTFVTNPPLATAGSATVSLQHGVSYRIFAVGQSDATVNAGLYSATVSPAGGGAPVYSKVVPVGTVAPVGSAALTGGTSYTLKLADLSYPTALASLSAVVATNGHIAAQINAAGTSPAFTATASTYQVFALASAVGTTTGNGSYTVTLAPQSGPPALSLARAVSAAGATTPSTVPYYFDTTVETAGSYQFDLTDFAVPEKFGALTAVAVQNGAVLGTSMSGTASQTVTVAAGPVSFLVFAQPGATGTGSLFGIDLTVSGAAAPVYEMTQGVGQLFSRRQVTFTTAGNYALTVADVGFPVPLATFAVYLTRGTNRVGSVYAGGPLKFAATPGDYYVNFIAQPGGTDKAGTYALGIVTAPAVTLTSDVTTVASGGVVHLTWSSQDATACTASGGWSGTQTLSGTIASTALTTATTFTLTCSDSSGVSDSQSVSVAIAAPAPKSGGGALGSDLLLLLAGAVVLRLSRFLPPMRVGGL